MFRCQVSNKLIGPRVPKDDNTRAFKIITKTRDVTYTYVKLMREGVVVKTIQVNDEELNDLARRGYADESNTFQTKGFEIIEEKLVCKEVYDNHVANGGKVC
jgi:hypothetical protein